MKRFLICIAALVLGLTGVSEAQLITEVSRGGSSANTPPTSGGTLVEGSGAMVDRNHAYKQIPDFLAGQAEYIKVANNDKSVANYQLTVTLAANADVYLFIDCRVGDGNPSTPPVLTSAMPWVSQMGFADTGAKIGIDEGSNGTINGWYQVYKAAYSAGNLTLGAQNNGGDRNMYGVAVTAFKSNWTVPFNGKDLFLSGANVAWINFGGDIGPGTTHLDQFAGMFSELQANGGNIMRLWLHTSGTSTPEWSGNDVIGPGVGAIDDLRDILDLAHQHNVSLMLCLWSFDMMRSNHPEHVLNRSRAILTNSDKRKRYIDNSLIPMVRALKGHPAILAWEIFNEAEGMSNEFGWGHTTHVPMADIQAFVGHCAAAIKETDPSAKVTTGAWSFFSLSDIPLSHNHSKNYYRDDRLRAITGKQNAVLDFYTVHYYTWAGTELSPFHHDAEHWHLDKPVVVAEFYAKDDIFGVSKKNLYTTLFDRGYAGALGWQWVDWAQNRENNYNSWPNILINMQNVKTLHPEAVTMARGITPVSSTASSVQGNNTANKAVDGKLNSRWESAWSDPQWFQVDLGSTHLINRLRICWEYASAKSYNIQVSANGSSWTTVYSTTTGRGGVETLTFPSIYARYVRINGTTRNTKYGYSIWEFDVYAAPNVARGKTVTASSNENGSLTPDKAVDAKSNTRWASAWADPQWYQVDLGATYTIDRIRIFWEAAAAKAFNIQVSANGISWTTVYSTTNGPGGTQDLKITPRTARYVRMNGISRKTIYGYSFWEFEVY